MEAVLGHAALLLQGRSGQGGHPRHSACRDLWLHDTRSLLCDPHHTAEDLPCLARAQAWMEWLQAA